jgi:hypothetical protein
MKTLSAKRDQKTRKRGFSDALARLQIHLRLTDDEKQGATKTFFTKVKEELDIIPAQARVLEYWLEKLCSNRTASRLSRLPLQRDALSAFCRGTRSGSMPSVRRATCVSFS